MNEKLFRSASIDRVNSPEQLNEYIRVSSPGVWLVLAAVVALLLGVVIWGVLGTVETTVETAVSVSGDGAVLYVSAQDAAQLQSGMAVTANGVTGTVLSVASAPTQAGDGLDDDLLYLAGLSRGELCCAVAVELPGLAPGVYAATVTVESLHPISFVTH